MGDTAAMNNGIRTGQSAMYPRGHFSPANTSPPFRSDVFRQSGSMPGGASAYATSPSAERHPSERIPPLSASLSDPSAFNQDTRPPSTILIRKLSKHTSRETLASMLIFAGDLIDTEFIRSPYPDDQGFATAVARFQSQAGAVEAQQKLHGKPNTTKEMNMVVELHGARMAGPYERRNTIDASSRTQTSSASSTGSFSGPPGRSRFGSTFQSPDQVSPPLPTSSSGGSAEFPMPESSAHFQNLFSPQSPLANGVDGRNGKYMINNDAVDDETGALLNDPVAYAENGQHPHRRATNPNNPIPRFGSLSLSTHPTNNNMNGHISSAQTPRATAGGLHSPLSPTHPYPSFPPPTPRAHYPPANPADQNPPCNTLYVGNLPLSTSEDELKALFSKQRGYKRLCFRTKQNGPMCFVEFEDVGFATKALHELYGVCLSNSVKGGVRLSFSKNPLGVRSGGGPVGTVPGYGIGGAGAAAFTAVSGPPPGLGTGSGMGQPLPPGYRAPPLDGLFANPFGFPAQPDFASQLGGQRAMVGFPPQAPVMNGGAFVNGRDGRTAGYNDYTLGR